MNPQTEQDIQRISQKWTSKGVHAAMSIESTVKAALTELATPLLERVEQLEKDKIHLMCENLDLANQVNLVILNKQQPKGGDAPCPETKKEPLIEFHKAGGSATEVAKVANHPPTSCCNYTCSTAIPYPVMWNEFNKVIQCHNCGQVFTPSNQTKS